MTYNTAMESSVNFAILSAINFLITQQVFTHLASVLDYHFAGFNISQAKQPSPVYVRMVNANGFLGYFLEISKTHGHG